MRSSPARILFTLLTTLAAGCGGMDGDDPASSTRQAQASHLASSSPIPIPDNNATGIASTLKMSSANQYITRVAVKIEHPYRGDLQVELTAPDGEAVVLRERTLWNKLDSREDLVIDRDVWRELAAARQQGTWRLHVSDLGKGDMGTLRSWSLEFEPVVGGDPSGIDEPPATDPDDPDSGASVQPCHGVCSYGATCSDYCPSGATCVGTYRGGVLVWTITGCGA